MQSVEEILNLSTQFLLKKGHSAPRRLAEDLLAFVLSLKRIDLYLQYDRLLLEEEISRMREFLKRAESEEPFEYIVGEMDFFGCQIAVNSSVLIPRPETELLVEFVRKRIVGSVLWDLCTGSGCIGISLKKSLPHLDVVLSDLSPKALEVASLNCLKNGVTASLKCGDLLIPFEGQKADVIVCNPPYVSESEYEGLESSLRWFEPKIAFVSGPSGLEMYERLAAQIHRFLNPGGRVFFEIGAGQGNAIKKIFTQDCWVFKEVYPDWSGKDRFFFLEMQ